MDEVNFSEVWQRSSEECAEVHVRSPHSFDAAGVGCAEDVDGQLGLFPRRTVVHAVNVMQPFVFDQDMFMFERLMEWHAPCCRRCAWYCHGGGSNTLTSVLRGRKRCEIVATVVSVDPWSPTTSSPLAIGAGRCKRAVGQ